MKRLDGFVSGGAARIRALGPSFESPPAGTSTAAVGGSLRRRRAGAVGVLVQSSARDKVATSELAAAYKDFIASEPQYLDAESGIKGSVYRFGTRVLVLYEDPETGVVVLIHPSAQRNCLIDRWSSRERLRRWHQMRRKRRSWLLSDLSRESKSRHCWNYQTVSLTSGFRKGWPFRSSRWSAGQRFSQLAFWLPRGREIDGSPSLGP